MCQSIPEEPVSLHCLDVQAEDRLPQRVHVGQPCGKASWESIVGKTRGKTVDPLFHAADCVTLLLPLWRKAQVHARIRDEDCLRWGGSRSTPRSMSALQRNPQESLVGKTRGKTIDPLINAADCVTLLLPLWRKAQVQARIRDEDDSPGETPEVPQDPCQHWTGNLRFRP
ncbi:hypothetical protein MJT46_018559 [Ovis ammon polii x Ovis aries]|nr:hypothetical protein MJT46_018559 [Ovis ammon polii x Ovis aries]